MLNMRVPLWLVVFTVFGVIAGMNKSRMVQYVCLALMAVALAWLLFAH
jgi:hypothetical protein